MNLLGTTGTRNISDEDVPRFVDYLTSVPMHFYLDSWYGFVSGGCIGWDAIFGETVALKYPWKEHVVVVPADRSRVDPWWEKFDLGAITLVYMDEGTSYRNRNEEIVRLSSGLFYCAEYPEDHGSQKRSGTWMTVRIARKAGIVPEGIIINDGSDSE